MVDTGELGAPAPELTLAESRADQLYGVTCAEEQDRFTTGELAGRKAQALKVDLQYWLEQINQAEGPDTLPIDETGVLAATKKVIDALDELAALGTK